MAKTITIRIPFTEEEYEDIQKIAKAKYMKKTPYVHALLNEKFDAFLQKNKFGVTLNFDLKNSKVDEENVKYIQIRPEKMVYEELKKISDTTTISIPYFCRYLILPSIRKETL